MTLRSEYRARRPRVWEAGCFVDRFWYMLGGAGVASSYRGGSGVFGCCSGVRPRRVTSLDGGFFVAWWTRSTALSDSAGHCLSTLRSGRPSDESGAHLVGVGDERDRPDRRPRYGRRVLGCPGRRPGWSGPGGPWRWRSRCGDRSSSGGSEGARTTGVVSPRGASPTTGCGLLATGPPSGGQTIDS